MSIMEIVSGVGGIIGAIGISIAGFDSYGWIGLILGIPIGFIGGSIFALLLIFLLYFMLIVKEKLQQRWKLKGTFGKYWSRSRTEQWKQLSSNLICNEKVEGKVICKFYYGVFINTEHGFPALLKCYQMTDDIEEINIGDTLYVFIKGLDDSGKFIEVSQKIPKIEAENL